MNQTRGKTVINSLTVFIAHGYAILKQIFQFSFRYVKEKVFSLIRFVLYLSFRFDRFSIFFLFFRNEIHYTFLRFSGLKEKNN